jgi:hypothetical protein
VHKWRQRRQRARHTRDVRAATFLSMSQNPKAVVRLEASFPPPDIVDNRSQVRRCTMRAHGIVRQSLPLCGKRQALASRVTSMPKCPSHYSGLPRPNASHPGQERPCQCSYAHLSNREHLTLWHLPEPFSTDQNRTSSSRADPPSETDLHAPAMWVSQGGPGIEKVWGPKLTTYVSRDLAFFGKD